MKKLFIVPILLSCALIYAHHVSADNLNSSLFRIENSYINSGAGKSTSTTYRLNTSLGQTAANEFSSAGYIVKAGFQYYYSIIPFQFSLSGISVNFGTLTPATPVTQSLTATVYFGAAGSYQVTAEEIGPLTRTDGITTIADTTCDGGVDTCTETDAKLWTSTSKYGFGYNMTGNDIPGDFISSSYFRPFPNANASEVPAVIMTSTNVGKNRQSQINMKVNISSIQGAGSYATVIRFAATPSF